MVCRARRRSSTATVMKPPGIMALLPLALQASAVVACASMLLNQWLDEPAWQLRGMATAPDSRGTGLGRAVVAFIESDIRTTQSVRLLWCNARVPASRFYLKMGWQVVSEEFEIPTAGPHVRMVKRL